MEGDDGDGVVVGEGEDAGAAVLVADAEVVHAAGSAEADFAVGADEVVADAVVAGGAGLGGKSFRGGAVGLSGC
ncbi:hypothetical protein GCM10009820_13080 [Leifsonia soli]